MIACVVPASLSRLLLAAALVVSSSPVLADDVPDDDEESAIAPAPTPTAPSVPPQAGVVMAGAHAIRLMGHVPVGKQPTTCVLADEGRTLYVANRGDNTVSVIDTAELEVTTTFKDVGYSAWGVAPLDASTLLVANWAGSSVALVDRATGKRTGELPTGMKPSYLAVSPDGARVYAAGNFGGDLSITDVKRKEIVRTLDMGRRPMGVALSKDGRWLYVAVCETKKIAKIDLKHEVEVEGFRADLASTTNLVLTPDGTRLLAAGDLNRLLVIDAETGKTEKVKVGTDPSSVAVTPDGSTAFVAGYGDNRVSVVDLASLEVVGAVPVGAGPIHVETDGTRLVTCNDKAASVSVFRLSPAESDAPVAPIDIPPAVTVPAGR